VTVAPVRKWSETRGRDAVRGRSLGCCEGCARTRAVHVHHRKNRSQGGTWQPANLMHLCLRCHEWIGREVEKARQCGWAVRRDSDPAAMPVFIYGDPWSPAWWLLSDGLSVASTVEEAVAAGLPERPVLPEWAEWSKT
jgi:hypothetical protein